MSEPVTVHTSEMMKALLEKEVKNPIEEGAILEGAVLSISKGRVYISLNPFGTGVIYGKEYIVAREILKNVHPGDLIKAKIVETENEDGYVELSLQEAKQAVLWIDAEKAMKDKTVFDLAIKDANKGGLMVEWHGIEGFLPASQLKSEHYPRIDDGDKDKILKELKKLSGTSLSVMILSVNPKEGKLIFSEKGSDNSERKELVTKYNVGDELNCEVTGAVDFGVFLKVEDGLEGLVHISEIDWGLVEDPRKAYKVGDKVRAKVIEVKDGKLSLSIKALKANPWTLAENKYTKDAIVDGVVIKFNKHGALVSIEEGVAGLIHVSTFTDMKTMKDKLELGKSYKFKINIFNPKEQKMTLTLSE